MPRHLNEQNIEIGPNYKLSEHDKAFMVIHYPHPKPLPGASTWTLKYALGVVGVDYDSKTRILEHAGDVDTLRQAFALWNTEQHKIERASPGKRRKIGSHQHAAVHLKPRERSHWCATGRSAHGGGIAADPLGAAYAVSIINASLWLPGDTIKYWYQQSAYRCPVVEGDRQPRKSRVHRLQSIFLEYESVANVKFKEAESEADSDARIYFREDDWDEFDQSWCMVGMMCKDPGTKYDPNILGGEERTTLYLNLPQEDTGESVNQRLLDRECRHEIGHLLGLVHEHLSPKQVKAGEAQNTTTPQWTAFDPQSIMLYPRQNPGQDGAALDEAQLKSIEGITALSTKDKAFLQVCCSHQDLLSLYLPGNHSTRLFIQVHQNVWKLHSTYSE